MITEKEMPSPVLKELVGTGNVSGKELSVWLGYDLSKSHDSCYGSLVLSIMGYTIILLRGKPENRCRELVCRFD